MKKIIGGIGFFVLVSIILASCSKTETYADKLKYQRRAINRLMGDSGFYTTNEYPKDRPFHDKEFYVDPTTGIYINVVDSGNGRRANAQTKTEVYVRFDDTWSLIIGASDTVPLTNIGNGYQNDYINFSYGQSGTYYESSTGNGSSNYYFKSQGLVAPLSYVGNRAIVRVIVPFGVGSTYQQQYYEPIFFGYVEYEFEKEQE